MLTQHDYEILRPLVTRYAEIAALPVQAEKRKLWLDHNELRDARPMVLIDQVCWNEMNVDGSLDLHCDDPFWRSMEEALRHKIYSWEHMPVDMVFNPYLVVPKPIHNTGWGMDVDRDILSRDEKPDVYSVLYRDVLEDESALEQIRMPEITLDEQEMQLRGQEADRLCEGLLPWVWGGEILHLGHWDKISEWRGVEACYMDIYDRPEYLHAIMERMTQGILHMIEQLNALKAYDIAGNMTHCSHTFTDKLPGAGADLNYGTTQQSWAFGLAQLFTSCSPAVTAEFEVPYMQRIFAHFGAIYYGCCERLDDRLDVIAQMPNIRKISCSPWSDRDHFAEVMPDRYIMSNKPNPALLATDSFDEEQVRRDLRHTIDAARRNNRHVEMIQKDISTVHHDPRRLWRWAQIAMEEAQR